jgi:NADH-quinone oxidoreductase subunit M
MLAAAYMLRLLQRVTWGAPTSFEPSWWDLEVREWVTLVPLAVLVLYIGLAPSLAIKTMEPSIERVLANMKSKNMAMGLTEDRHLAQRLHLPDLTVPDGPDQIKKERPRP